MAERPPAPRLSGMADDDRLRRIRKSIKPYRVEPGSRVDLAHDFDPADTGGFFDEEQSTTLLNEGIGMLSKYQARLAAQDQYGLLVVLQALDAAGKDSTIKHVMSGVNPQGVDVHGFRAPSDEEHDHDFLWRYQQKVPARGQITIFNRSHYEEVLVVRVHPELLEQERLPADARREDVWDRRYRQINDWERYLVENGFPVVKLLLNVSKEEQRKRFLKRIDHPKKNWKFSSHDVQERSYWDEYQTAFSHMLSATSTKHAPWYVVPADHKWFLRVAVAAVIVNALADIDPQFPVVDDTARQALLASREKLEAEAPEPAEAGRTE
jgi:PPK2 family polyphosphate:nucleotide phosphotransferase